MARNQATTTSKEKNGAEENGAKGNQTGKERSDNKGKLDGKKSQPMDSETDSKSNNSRKNATEDRSQSKNSESGGDTGEVNSAESNPSGEAQKQRNSSRENRARPQSGSESDKANLEYAKETTDLVLEKLKDQKQNPDEDLLKDLNWTKEELQEFTKRWEQMKKKASSGSERDKNAFQNALKSLGLEAPSNSLQKPELRDDDKGGYKESSSGRSVPSDFQDQFRAIQKSKRKLRKSDSR